MDEENVHGAEEVQQPATATPAEDVKSEPIVETPAQPESEDEEDIADPEDETAHDSAASAGTEPAAEPAEEAV